MCSYVAARSGLYQVSPASVIGAVLSPFRNSAAEAYNQKQTVRIDPLITSNSRYRRDADTSNLSALMDDSQATADWFSCRYRPERQAGDRSMEGVEEVMCHHNAAAARDSTLHSVPKT